MTTSTWTDKLGRRGRRGACLICSKNGEIKEFQPEGIPGVCAVTHTTHKKNGQWSSVTYLIEHHAGTAVVPIRQSWEGGRFFDFPTWDDAYGDVRNHAPYLIADNFRAFVRERFPGVAKRLDAADAAIEAFSGEDDEAELASLETARAAAEKEYETMAQSPFAKLRGRVAGG